MHFKNFAMFHTPTGFRLAPSYDHRAAALYQYKTVALAIGNARDMQVNKLAPANIIKLGEEYNLKSAAIKMAVDVLAKNIETARQTISTFKYELEQAVKKYNTYRPHFSLNGLTLFDYTKKILVS